MVFFFSTCVLKTPPPPSAIEGSLIKKLCFLPQAIHPTEVSLKIFQNGTIFYTMRRHLVLNCEGDLPIFPFDSPMCDFNIESSKYLLACFVKFFTDLCPSLFITGMLPDISPQHFSFYGLRLTVHF